MMNRYLQKLHSLEGGAIPQKTETRHPDQPSKPSKPRFDGFDGDQDMPVSQNERGYTEPEAPENRTAQVIQNPYVRTFAALTERCPAYVEMAEWQQAIADGSTFLAKWGEQAEALGWTAADLFGLPAIPDRPHPSYSRLSRFDEIGPIWLLRGRPVVALTATTASIRTTGVITNYRKLNRPAQQEGNPS